MPTLPRAYQHFSDHATANDTSKQLQPSRLNIRPHQRYRRIARSQCLRLLTRLGVARVESQPPECLLLEITGMRFARDPNASAESGSRSLIVHCGHQGSAGRDARLLAQEQKAPVSSRPEAKQVATTVFGIVGLAVGVGGLSFAIWREFSARAREKQREGREKAAEAQRTLDACLDLNELLGEWLTAVERAVRRSDTPEATLSALGEFMRGYSFDNRLRRKLGRIPDSEAHELHRLAGRFGENALNRKQSLDMALKDGKFWRDYDAHKDEAIKALTRDYRAFNAELDRIEHSLRNAT